MEIQSGDLALGLLTQEHREAIKAQHKLVYSYEDILASEINKANPVLKGHTNEVMSLALTSDNSLLLSCSKDNTVRIWSLIRRKEEQKIEIPVGASQTLQRMAASPDSKFLVLADSDKHLIIWNIELKKVVATLTVNLSETSSLAISPDSRYLAAPFDEKIVVVWELSTGREVKRHELHTCTPRFVCFTDRNLLSCDGEGNVIAWNVEKGVEEFKLQHENFNYYNVSGNVSLNYHQLALGFGESKLVVWNLGDRTIDFSLDLSHGRLTAIHFAKESTNLVCSTAEKKLLFVDLSKKKLLKSIIRHNESINDVVQTKDGKLIITASSDKSIKVYQQGEIQDYKASFKYGKGVTTSALDKNRENLVIGYNDRSIKVFGLAEDREIFNYMWKGQSVNVAILTHDKKHLITSNDKPEIVVYSVETKELEYTLTGIESYTVNSLILSSDSKWLYGGDSCNHIYVWDFEKKTLDHKLEHEKQGNYRFAFSADGQKLYSGGDSCVKIWDLPTKTVTTILECDNAVKALVLLSDNKTLISGGNDGKVRFWNLEDNTVVSCIEEGGSWARDMFLYKDEQLLAVVHDTSKVTIVNVPEKKIEFDFEAPNSMYTVKVLDDNNTLIMTDSNNVRFWNLEQKKEETVVQAHTSTIPSLLLLKESDLFITVSNDRTVKEWSLSGKNLTSMYQSYCGNIKTLAIVDDHVLIGSEDSNVILMSISEKKELKSFSYHSGTVQSVDMRNGVFASGGNDYKVYVFDSNEYKPHCFAGHTDWVRSVKLSVDSKLVFSGSDDKTVRAWNIEKKELEFKLEGHEGYVYSLCVFPSGKLLASGSGDKRVKIWDLLLRKEVSSLESHSGSVISLALSDDEKILYSGSEDLTIVISDVQQKKSICTFSGHTSSINRLDIYNNILYSTGYDDEVKTWLTTEKREEFSFKWRTDYSSFLTVSPDGTYLAAGFDSGAVRIYNLKQEKFLDTFMPLGSSSIDKLQFTHDSKQLVIGASGASIIIWDIEQKFGTEIRGSKTHSRSLKFSPDFKYLVSAGYDNKIMFWDFEHRTLEFSLEGHVNSVNTFVFTPCGKTLFSGADDNKIIRWNIETKEKVFEYAEHTGSVKSLALAHSKNILVSGANDAKVIFWNIETNEKLFVGDKHTDWVRGVAVSHDESFAVSGSDDRSIHLWDLNDNEKQIKHSFKSHTNYVHCIAFSADGNHFFSTSSDKTILSWDFVNKKKDKCIRSTCGNIYCIAINSDGTRAYTGSDENTINVFDLENRSEIACFGGHTRTIGDLALSKDEKILVSGSFDYTLKVFHLSDYSEIATFGEGVHSDYVRSVAITDDNKYVVSGSDDKLIVVWNLAEKKKEFSLEGHRNYVYSIRFTRDYKYLISASRDETLKLWDFTARTDLHTFTGHTALVKCLAVFHDNSGFISGSEDYSIKVWNILDRREAFTLQGHSGTVNTLFLTSDDLRLISGSDDRVIKVWNLETRSIESAMTSYSSGILSVALTFDAKYLLTSGSDRTLKLWKMSEPVVDFGTKTTSSKPYLSVYTPDDDYELVYLYGRIDSVSKRESSSRTCVDIGITDVFDPYYQNLLMFYNILDSLKNDTFDALLPDSAGIVFSKFKYSILHVLCLKGNQKAIEGLLNDKAVITADYFGKSPLFYALVRQNQGCIDMLLEFLISLSGSKDKSRVSTCFSVISNDLAMIISNSSKKLHLLLKSCLIPTDPTFARVNNTLPIFIYNEKFLPITTDFVGEPPRTVPLVPVIMRYTPFKVPALLGSQESIEFLEAVLNCSNTEIYNVHLIRYLIQTQWDSLILWISSYSFLLWLNLLLLVILFTVDNLIETWALPVFLLCNFLLMTWESVQMYMEGLVEYFKDTWNIIDFCRFSLSMTWVLLNIFEDDHGLTYRIIAWLVALLNFTRGLTGFRLFDGTRYYVRLILRALGDMGYFFILLGYSTITFGVMFQVSRKDEPFEFKTLWMDSYSLNFGNFEPQDNYQFSFETSAYMLATIVNVILMLNLLISILGDSYSNFQTEKVYVDISEKAGVILEIQKMYFWVGRESNNKYFQVLCSASDAVEEVAVDEMIDTIDKKIDNFSTELTNTNQATRNELGDSIKLLSNKVESIETKLAGLADLETKLAGLTENVLKVIELVTPKEVKVEEVKAEEVKSE